MIPAEYFDYVIFRNLYGLTFHLNKKRSFRDIKFEACAFLQEIYSPFQNRSWIYGTMIRRRVMDFGRQKCHFLFNPRYLGNQLSYGDLKNGKLKLEKQATTRSFY